MARQDGRAKDERGLTVRQARFVNEYLIDLNATRAAERAGFAPGNSAVVQGSRMLSHAKVRAAIDEAMKRRAERVEIKAGDVLRELLRVATADLGQAYKPDGTLRPIHEMPEDVRRAISNVVVEEKTESVRGRRRVVGKLKRVQFWDKNRGLELLAKHLGLLREKVELTGKDGGPVQHLAQKDLEGYTDEDLAEIEAIHLRAQARRAQKTGNPTGDDATPPEKGEE